MKMRINKLVAERCEVSRRKADQMIEDGRVTIKGRPIKLGTLIDEHEEFDVDGSATVHDGQQQQIVIALNKPVGYMTTTDPEKTDTVMDLVHWDEGRLFPIGRLDVESSGLILLTNDGKLANELMHPRYEHEKEYEVEVDHPLAESDLMQLRHGVSLDGRNTKPAQVLRLSERRFRIVIQEGRNRQIRRMCEAIHYRVLHLQRIRIAGLELGSLKLGAWKVLKPSEVKKYLASGDSKKGKQDHQSRKRPSIDR